MTDIVKRLEELREKATPGPWECGDSTKGESPLMIYCNDRTGQRVADLTNDLTFHTKEMKAANTALICELVNSLPTILSALKEREWMVSRAVQDVLTERRRQVDEEGWTPEHDDEHKNGEMALAAACYARGYSGHHGNYPEDSDDGLWPWHPSWWKPTNRRRNLVKAAALIIADIEREDRAVAPVSTQEAGE